MFLVFVSSPLQSLDYEKKPSYTVEIQVQNIQVDTRFMSAGSKDMATVRIAVEDVDEPPLFDKASYLMEVKEDAAVGVAVGSVSAIDPDGARSIVKWDKTSSRFMYMDNSQISTFPRSQIYCVFIT